MKTACCIGLVAWVLISWTTYAQATTKPATPDRRVAVLPFINATGLDRYDSLCDGLMLLVAGDLARVNGIGVVEREQLDVVIAEHGLQRTGLTDKETIQQLGGWLGAELLITGSFSLETGRLRIDLRAINAATASIVATAAAVGPVADVLEIEKQALNILLHTLARHNGPPRELAVDDTPETTLHFIRGLGHFFENQYEAAIAEFLMLAASETERERARYWIARCYFELKDKPHCAVECRAYLAAFPQGPHSEEITSLLKKCSPQETPPNS